MGFAHIDTLSRCSNWPIHTVPRYESESGMDVYWSGETFELSIIITTIWLLAVVVVDVIITARLTSSFLFDRRPILLGLVVGLSWLGTLSSWVFITSVLAPTDSRQLIFIFSGFVALASSVIFGIASGIASATRPRR